MEQKLARQLRSRQTRDSILESMEALLRQKSFDEISVVELAARAGVSAATLYQRFRNEDVLGAVLLSLYYQCVEAWAQRRPASPTGPASVAEALQAVAADGWDLVAAWGHVIRPAYLYSRQHPGRTGPEWGRLQQQAQLGFRRFIEARASDLPPQDLEEAATVLGLAMNLLLLGPLLHPEEPLWQPPGGRATYIRHVGTLASRFLRLPDPA